MSGRKLPRLPDVNLHSCVCFLCLHLVRHHDVSVRVEKLEHRSSSKEGLHRGASFLGLDESRRPSDSIAAIELRD